MDSREVGLLNLQTQGLRPVGNQSQALGYTDTHRLASINTLQSRSQLLSLPAQSVIGMDHVCSQADLNSRVTQPDAEAKTCNTEKMSGLDTQECPVGGMLDNYNHLLEKERDRSQRGWSWIAGGNCHTAQWVKQKQEYRSTRPW